MSDSVISKEQYFFFLNAGIPYEGWVDYGDGEFAYALREVEIVSIPINKYNDHFLKIDSIAVCVKQPTIQSDSSKMDVSKLSISKKGLEFLIKREGVRLAPYNDSKGYATIGVGHLIAKRNYTAQDKLDWAWLDTEQEAMDLLKKDLSKTYEPAIRQLVTVVLSQEEYDAIVSFTYNVGVGGLQKSNFLRELNKGKYDGNLMLRYKRPSEILGRRQKEVNLFNKGVYK